MVVYKRHIPLHKITRKTKSADGVYNRFQDSVGKPGKIYNPYGTRRSSSRSSSSRSRSRSRERRKRREARGGRGPGGGRASSKSSSASSRSRSSSPNDIPRRIKQVRVVGWPPKKFSTFVGEPNKLFKSTSTQNINMGKKLNDCSFFQEKDADGPGAIRRIKTERASPPPRSQQQMQQQQQSPPPAHAHGGGNPRRPPPMGTGANTVPLQKRLTGLKASPGKALLGGVRIKQEPQDRPFRGPQHQQRRGRRRSSRDASF